MIPWPTTPSCADGEGVKRESRSPALALNSHRARHADRVDRRRRIAGHRVAGGAICRRDEWPPGSNAPATRAGEPRCNAHLRTSASGAGTPHATYPSASSVRYFLARARAGAAAGCVGAARFGCCAASPPPVRSACWPARPLWPPRARQRPVPSCPRARAQRFHQVDDLPGGRFGGTSIRRFRCRRSSGRWRRGCAASPRRRMRADRRYRRRSGRSSCSARFSSASCTSTCSMSRSFIERTSVGVKQLLQHRCRRRWRAPRTTYSLPFRPSAPRRNGRFDRIASSSRP